MRGRNFQKFVFYIVININVNIAEVGFNILFWAYWPEVTLSQRVTTPRLRQYNTNKGLLVI